MPLLDAIENAPLRLNELANMSSNVVILGVTGVPGMEGSNVDTEDDDNLGPGLDPHGPEGLDARLEHSRIKGDYYRDLSLNYSMYEQTGFFPEHPFPNEKYTYSDVV